MYGDEKITEFSLKLVQKIERKTEKDYFYQLLDNFAKSINL